MTPDDAAPRRPLARPAHLVRRALAPAGLELAGQLSALQQEFADLRAADDRLREELDEAHGRTRELEAEVARLRGLGDEVGALREEVARLRDGLHEERRLHLRVAELTDLVTELVLPLHDREIDPAVLRSLRPETT
ncbi:DUF6752 domain-containing protein [Geodermatophilus sp. SYSU D01119]